MTRKVWAVTCLLFSTGEATAGVLCSVWAHQHKRDKKLHERSNKGPWMWLRDWRISLLYGKRDETFQPGEKGQRKSCLWYSDTWREAVKRIEPALSSGAQWQMKRQWGKTETQKAPFTLQETQLLGGWLDTSTGCSERLQRSPSLEILKKCLDMAMGNQTCLSKGGWKMWTSGVPSNLKHSLRQA